MRETRSTDTVTVLFVLVACDNAGQDTLGHLLSLRFIVGHFRPTPSCSRHFVEDGFNTCSRAFDNAPRAVFSIEPVAC
jgi:hypothetical protein